MKIHKTPRIFRFIFKQVTWGFPLNNNSVYLTFDDGPHPEITPWVLDVLKQYHFKATFFCVGENVLKYPEIFKRILDEGHSIGNHTMHHENAFKVKYSSYIQSIMNARKQIPSKLFRPPYGKLTPLLYKKIRKEYKIIMWSWMAYDFDFSISTKTIHSKAIKQIRSGDIIVLHDNPKFKDRLKIILPDLLEILKKKNLNGIRLKEL
jgi:peptidoglycan/xylan/chitin deacetylase (PgdA/CDA1 family)